MYKAYLSFNQLREYLALLVENGLIEYQDGMQTYKTTEKGITFIANTEQNRRNGFY